MGINPSRALSLSSGSSLAAKAMEARAILQCVTSPQQALSLAEQMVGCWPHAKPPDPKTYMAAISATLAGYPLKVAQECADPRVGLARKREFPPTVAAIVAWCDERHEFYQSVGSYSARTPAPGLELPPDPEQAAQISAMLTGVVHAMRVNPEASPLDRLQTERRDELAMTRKSVLERGGAP